MLFPKFVRTPHQYCSIQRTNAVSYDSVGRPKHQKVMMGGLEEADVYIGRKAQELRGLLKIKYPVEHGIVSQSLRRSLFARFLIYEGITR
jgi:hypothetical protein